MVISKFLSIAANTGGSTGRSTSPQLDHLSGEAFYIFLLEVYTGISTRRGVPLQVESSQW